MPELPEVQTIADELTEVIKGLDIVSLNVSFPRILSGGTVGDFGDFLIGQKVHRVTRRAKFLVFELDEGYLLSHLRMTGQFSQRSYPEACKHTHLVLGMSDGSFFHYKDTRKFGRFYRCDDLKKHFAAYGPEPFDPSLEKKFFSMLNSRKRQLKPLLLDQSFLSGLGNIYVDEALHDSKLHPESLSSSVSRVKSKELLASIRKVLEIGLRNLGTSLGTGAANYYSVSGRSGRNQDALQVFRRTGESCNRCSSIILRIMVGQRSTHFCPKCQRKK